MVQKNKQNTYFMCKSMGSMIAQLKPHPNFSSDENRKKNGRKAIVITQVHNQTLQQCSGTTRDDEKQSNKWKQARKSQQTYLKILLSSKNVLGFLLFSLSSSFCLLSQDTFSTPHPWFFSPESLPSTLFKTTPKNILCTLSSGDP